MELQMLNRSPVPDDRRCQPIACLRTTNMEQPEQEMPSGVKRKHIADDDVEQVRKKARLLVLQSRTCSPSSESLSSDEFCMDVDKAATIPMDMDLGVQCGGSLQHISSWSTSPSFPVVNAAASDPLLGHQELFGSSGLSVSGTAQAIVEWAVECHGSSLYPWDQESS